MSNIKAQTEALQISIYCNIIEEVLQTHNILSVCKLIVFSYLIKQNKFLGGVIYSAKNSQDNVYKGLSLLSGDFNGLCESMSYIIKSLHLLISNNIVSCNGSILTLTDDEIETVPVYKENNFIKKQLKKVKKCPTDNL